VASISYRQARAIRLLRLRQLIASIPKVAELDPFVWALGVPDAVEANAVYPKQFTPGYCRLGLNQHNRWTGYSFHSRPFETRKCVALIATHGWPGSIIEQMKIIEPLTSMRPRGHCFVQIEFHNAPRGYALPG
jgi:hypothetical protein